MITTVNTTDGLLSALKTAQSGDVIQLTAGIYSNVSISNINIAGGVTIASQDPAHQATLSDLTVKSSSGLTFENLEFRTDLLNKDNSFQVGSSQDIHFDHLNVHGSLDNDPKDDVSAMLVRNSSGVSVTNSEFQQVVTAIGHLDSDHVTISGNSFHDLRKDSIHGGGSSYVTISDNSFTSYHPNPGDHGDSIQFWTTNTTTSAHDITIVDNVFVRGAGDRAQGVFIADEVGTLPYQHVTISGNLISGGMYNGIYVGHGEDVTITDNIVQGFSDEKSWIKIGDTVGAVVSDNQANLIAIQSTVTNVVNSGNVVLPLASDGGAAAIELWRADHTSLTAADAPAAVISYLPAANATASTTGLSLTGDAGDNRLLGAAGDDTIMGAAGNDTISGGDGVGYLRGDDGNDSITGGSSFDDINGNQGNDTASGGDGDDWVVGGKDNDSLSGDNGADLVYGNLGNDTCLGGNGDDTVRGGQGDDSVSGGDGNDFISGDLGNDTMTGGAGADIFHSFTGAGIDKILDFNAAEGDRVLLDPGTSYTVAQVGADTVITLGSTSDEVILVGVHMSSLPEGWIFGA